MMCFPGVYGLSSAAVLFEKTVDGSMDAQVKIDGWTFSPLRGE